MSTNDWRPILQLLEKDPDSSSRNSAIYTLSRLCRDDASVADKVAEVLRSGEISHGSARAALAQALGAVAQRALPKAALLVALSDEDARVRDFAAFGLQTAIADPAVRRAMIAAAEDPSITVRTTVAKGLGHAEQTLDVLMTLETLLRDESDGVKEAALQARYPERANTSSDTTGASSRTGGTLGVERALQAIKGVKEEIDRLLSTDVTELERGFLLTLQDDLDDLADLVQRSAPEEEEEEVARTIRGLERLWRRLTSIAQPSVEVATLILALKAILDTFPIKV